MILLVNVTFHPSEYRIKKKLSAFSQTLLVQLEFQQQRDVSETKTLEELKKSHV